MDVPIDVATGGSRAKRLVDSVRSWFSWSSLGIEKKKNKESKDGAAEKKGILRRVTSSCKKLKEKLHQGQSGRDECTEASCGREDDSVFVEQTDSVEESASIEDVASLGEDSSSVEFIFEDFFASEEYRPVRPPIPDPEDVLVEWCSTILDTIPEDSVLLYRNFPSIEARLSVCAVEDPMPDTHDVSHGSNDGADPESTDAEPSCPVAPSMDDGASNVADDAETGNGAPSFEGVSSDEGITELAHTQSSNHEIRDIIVATAALVIASFVADVVRLDEENATEKVRTDGDTIASTFGEETREEGVEMTSEGVNVEDFTQKTLPVKARRDPFWERIVGKVSLGGAIAVSAVFFVSKFAAKK